MLYNPFTIARLYARRQAAIRYAIAKGIPGLEFDRFGQQVGWQLIARGSRNGLGYVLNPVSITRYFEFAFARACLPTWLGQCLDVSSPRLFSLYAGRHAQKASIQIINPDLSDLSSTAAIIRTLRMTNIETQHCDMAQIATDSRRYDCIWSLSVFEHIAGAYDDRDAVKLVHSALNPGGRLILTVPVDRKFWIEDRDQDYYGTQPVKGSGAVFFQRYYDEQAIRERLLAPIKSEPSTLRWFGEAEAGRYAQYEKNWMRDGYACTVNDPREIVDHYREFSTWEEMPGVGVCGVMIEKR